MIVLATIFFVVYTISFGVIISIGFLRQRTKEEAYLFDERKIDTDQVTVLIPFRNEEKRIRPLLKCINDLKTYPAEIIFIDDHSDDHSVKIIKDELNGLNYRVLKLPDDQHGKKKALRHAIKEVETCYILTMDADVEFSPFYFDSMGELGEADMYVLPAIMIPERFHERIYELDLDLVNAANAGLSGIARPIIASGANLLYKKETFEEVDDLESHAHAASGDDTYLLRDFRENRKNVRLVTDPAVAITTETPQSFKEFIDQRLRWIGKTGDMKDHLSTFLAVVQSLLTMMFVSLLIIFLIQGDLKLFFTMLILKTVVDLFLFFPFFDRIGRTSTWFFIPVYEILFPVYTGLLIILLPFYKPKWKGRVIYEKKAR